MLQVRSHRVYSILDLTYSRSPAVSSDGQQMTMAGGGFAIRVRDDCLLCKERIEHSMRTIDLIPRARGIRVLSRRTGAVSHCSRCRTLCSLSIQAFIVQLPRPANRIWGRSGLKIPDAYQARENSTASPRPPPAQHTKHVHLRLLQCDYDDIWAVMLTSSALWGLTTHHEVKLQLGCVDGARCFLSRQGVDLKISQAGDPSSKNGHP
jgi:hypothetical protein